jgi:hypothetical protein
MGAAVGMGGVAGEDCAPIAPGRKSWKSRTVKIYDFMITRSIEKNRGNASIADTSYFNDVVCVTLKTFLFGKPSPLT